MPDRAVVTGIFGGSEPRSTNAVREDSMVGFPTGVSPLICHVKYLIDQVAAFDSTVLLLGESGTGKEVVARAIHEASPRRLRPFVPINCGAFPAELLESELFGHEKGAFTDALGTRKGRFEIAEGGTIFLDEIGDMNPIMQVKLLRVLQQRLFERVGSCVSQRCDVRIIAATHPDLEQAIAKGTFREDLFYRLNVVAIEMPALRDRGEHLPLLIADRSARYRPLDWNPADEVTRETLLASVPVSAVLGPALLETLSRAIIERRSPEEASESDSDEPPPIEASFADGLLEEIPEGFDLRNYLETLEQRLIVRALEEAGGIVAHAARLLGLRRTTLLEKLRKYGLTTPDGPVSET